MRRKGHCREEQDQDQKPERYGNGLRHVPKVAFPDAPDNAPRDKGASVATYRTTSPPSMAPIIQAIPNVAVPRSFAPEWNGNL